MKEKIGFVGLGIMGSGMASNLINKGFEVVGWNRTRARAEAIDGIEVAESPQAVAETCPVVMICVSDSPDVEAVTTGEAGIIGAVRPGSLVVDHSTISPTVTRKLAEAIASRGGSWIDAPVSGGSEGAARGTLSIMVGGETADVERARRYMEAYGTSITHVGRVGDGQLVKLVNQILVVVNQLAVSEALLFAKTAGLDLPSTLDAVKGGAAGSWMLSNRGPQMIAGDWRPGFTIDLQVKDLRLVLEEADRLGFPAVATGLVFQLYRGLQTAGRGEEGNHALVKALESLAGVKLDGVPSG